MFTRIPLFLPALFLLLLPSTGHTFGRAPVTADACREEAEVAYREGVHRLVLSFEGLAMPAKGPVYDRIMTGLQGSHGGQFYSHPFRYTQGDDGFVCAREWKAVHGDELELSILGHSFGGGIAVQNFLTYTKAASMNVKNVITMDPRNSGSRVFGCPSAEPGREKFSKPEHVENYRNFYQCGGGLAGEHVAGTENTRISGFGHVALPGSPEIYRTVEQLIFP